MGNLKRRGSINFFLLCALVGAVSPSLAAIWLFAEAALGNGSHSGNILRIGIGLSLVLVSVLVLGTAAIYMKAAAERTKTRPGTPSSDFSS